MSIATLIGGALAETAVGWAALGGVYGFIAGAAAGLLRGRWPRVRAALASGGGLAPAAAVGGGGFPVAVAVAPDWILAEVSSTAVWFLVGAVVGGIGYTRAREPSRPFAIGETEGAASTPSGAATWGLSVGVFAAAVWLGELGLLRLLPAPFTIGPLLVRGDVIEVAGLFAVAAGGIGLVVGATFGMIFGTPSRLTSGLARGLGFAAVGAVGGGLFPLVGAATSRWLPQALSSALTWGVVSGVAAAIASFWSRRQRPEQEVEAEYPRTRRQRLTELHIPGSAGSTPFEPALLRSASSGWADPTPEEPSPVVTSGRDPEPVIATQAAPLPVMTAGRSASSDTAFRLAPVLMVSVACLVAVGLSTPSPVGWAMLAIGLLGLAVAWALFGQERRIRDLERRLAARERAVGDAES
jgi:hypothetical protein